MAHSSFLHQPVGPKAGTPGTSAPSAPDNTPAAQPAPMNTWVMLAPAAVMAGVLLFSGRSQRKREAETRAKLKKGDRVVSNSGLVGELVELDDKLAKVKIAPGTNVQMLTSSIAPFDPAPAAASSTDKSLADLKDAKAAEKKA